MSRLTLRCLITSTCLTLTALAGSAFMQPAYAQANPTALPVVGGPAETQGNLSLQRLDQLVAPVALYPDQVLTDILAAATYPAQVVEAERFVTNPAHAGMDGVALSDASEGEDWDPSVKALLMFPRVLQMMDSNLDWTEHLGRAFMAQQADVLTAVQRLRLAAEQAGTLGNGPYAAVVNDGGDVLINPPSPEAVYVPDYQAQCVFGPDPACGAEADQVLWASDVFLPYGYVPWGYLDWGVRGIRYGQPGHDGSAGHSGHRAAGDGASVWRHTDMRRASFGGSLQGHEEGFSYAPPANAPFARQATPGRLGSFAGAPRFAAPAHFATAPGFRPAPVRAPAFHAAPAIGAFHAAAAGHR